MADKVAFYYNKIAMNYSEPKSSEGFNFVTLSAETTAGDDHDNWIDILAIDWGAHEPAAEVVQSAGLRSDGELVQAVSDADMCGDFIF